ncbi:MAG: hypothetical protein QXG51_03335 [Nitrososphaerota archaeon]
MSKILIVVMSILMFVAGAYAAVNYPPMAGYLGLKGTVITEVRTVPTTLTSTLTSQTTIATTMLSTSTYTVTSKEFITTTLIQVASFVTEVTRTVTTTVTAVGTTTVTPTTTIFTTTPSGTTAISAELINPSRIYFSDAFKVPGAVYVYDYQYHNLGILFNVTGRRISCFTFHPGIAEKVYYVDANTREIRLYLLGVGDYGKVFNHTTYIRCIRFGPENRLYFSEATGARENGKIYKIVMNEAKLYYEVKLQDVGGSWAGNFEFDDEGKLYLSSGNVVPANLYVVVNVNQAPSKIATFNFPVMGIRYVKGIILQAEGRRVSVNKGFLLTTFGSSIYLYDLDSRTLYKIYENSIFTWLSDVSF